MRAFASFLAVTVLLAGCASFSSSSSERTTTMTSTRVLLETSLAVPDGPMGEAAVEFDLPANASSFDVQLTASNSAGLSGSAAGCSTGPNTGAAVGGTTRISFSCADLAPGTYTLTVRRDAGVGPVDVTVTASVTEVLRG